ncbi:MAG: ATP-dependent Clp protease adaptor ClpS [Planctomycetota bacterium]
MSMPHHAAKTKTQVAVLEAEDTKLAGPWHVILHNDNDHSYQYVIEMLGRLFGHSAEKAFRMAKEVDSTGRAIVDTTSKERAELKRDQIHAFGKDPLIERCAGSMSSSIELA